VSTSIRAPRRHELGLLRDIERAAGALFADAGLPEVAAHEPASVEELAAYLDTGRAWVAAVGDQPVGYALVDVVDGVAHLEQLSVHPDFGRRGLGASLLAHVCEWSRAQGFDAVTLTTFEHLAWNAPFYARHGFEELAEHELGPELRRLRDDETRHGLDPRLRVCMRRRLGGGPIAAE
jgi:GNAT superfamily N-acetyltransferase